MMQKLLLLVCFISVVSGSKVNVLELDNDNFLPILRQHETTLVMFYAPWCGYCKKLKPEYEEAAEIIKNDHPPITLAQVDCSGSGSEICSVYSISGYPKLKIFRGDDFFQDYDGPRNANGIANYMRTNIVPLSKNIVSLEELMQFLDTEDTTLFGYFKDPDSELAKNFLEFARKKREAYRFGHTNDAHILEKQGETNKIALIRPPHLSNKFEESTVAFEGQSESDLSKFVTENYHGLVGHRNLDNVKDFKNPLVVAYYPIDYIRNRKGTNYWRNRVLKVAKEFKGKLNFAFSSKDDFQPELIEFGYDYVGDKPLVLARDTNDRKYVLTEEFSVDSLRDFGNKLLNGTLKPFIKSEPVPKTNDAPVKIAVANNFEETVINNGKDTLVEFYAPWCGHCKDLAPIYDELAKKLQNEQVEFVKMDATANDIPSEFTVAGFPALYWLPKNAKNKPVVYNEDRAITDFIKFIATHATNELKGFDRSGKSKKTEL